jgi:hypothetical protein
MKAQEKALQLYNDAYSRWCTELSHDKNKLIAKTIATYVCDELLDLWENQQPRRFEEWLGIFDYLLEVKQEIEKL